MGVVEEYDVRELLKDKAFRDDIVKAVIEDPAAKRDLAGDVADELDDLIEDDPEIRSQIVETAISDEDFRKSVVREVVEDMS